MHTNSSTAARRAAVFTFDYSGLTAADLATEILALRLDLSRVHLFSPDAAAGLRSVCTERLDLATAELARRSNGREIAPSRSSAVAA